MGAERDERLQNMQEGRLMGQSCRWARRRPNLPEQRPGVAGDADAHRYRGGRTVEDRREVLMAGVRCLGGSG